ncbi:MAG: hypothetical protein A3H17_03335, partial [Candidatus Levybacteria bacterium RIFCSPLOWO2_12_FULL_37_14]
NWRDLRHSWAGGGEIYVFEQASRWVKMGHEVILFCGQDPYQNLPSFEIINGIKIYRKGGRFNVYLWAIYYYFTLFRGKVDIVIDVENGIPFFTPLFCRVPKICYVYHIHGKQFLYEFSPPLSHIGFAIEKFLFPLLYGHLPIIAISETTKKQLIDIGFKKDNINVVYCGMNSPSQPLKRSAKKFLNPTIVYLGRIRRYKRVNLLVNMFQKIVEKVPKTRMIIAGWGTEASHLADLIMKNPLRRRIKLMGPVSNEEKRILLSRSWLFVNPSIGEGWSMAVIEANLYGTPAVSFDVPGLAESIQHGKTGLLAQNEEDFVNKICEILKDNSFRERLNKNATLWANGFNWDQSAKESLNIFKKARRYS